MIRGLEIRRVHVLVFAAILVAFALASNVHTLVHIFGALAEMQDAHALAEIEANRLRRERDDLIDEALERLKAEDEGPKAREATHDTP